MSDLPALAKTGAEYARDLAERVVFTFVEGFVGGIVVTEALDVSMWHAALAGGVAAAAALLKGVAAKAFGDKNSASLSGRV